NPLPVVRAGQLAESRAGRSRNWRRELWMIQRIDELRVELETQPFPDLGVLDRRHVEIVYTRRPNPAESGGERLDVRGELLAGNAVERVDIEPLADGSRA